MHESTRNLFKPPFKLCPIQRYIRDANNNTMASQTGACVMDSVDNLWEARGWGRISYMENADVLMDNWESDFKEIVGKETYASNVLQMLNQAWEAHPG